MANSSSFLPVATNSSPRFESIFVGNLSFFCTNDQLWALFAPFGSIQSAVVCRSKNKDPLYYGFVNMVSSPGVDIAIKTLNHMFFMGRNLKVMRSSRGSTADSNTPHHSSGVEDIDQGYQILVSFVSSSLGGVPNQPPLVVNEETLFHVFRRFGEVSDVLVKQYSYSTSSQSMAMPGYMSMPVLSHKQCGYGFVLYQDWPSAQQAMQAAKLDPHGDQSMGIKLDCRLSTLTAQKLKRENRLPEDYVASSNLTDNSPNPALSQPFASSNVPFPISYHPQSHFQPSQMTPPPSLVPVPTGNTNNPNQMMQAPQGTNFVPQNAPPMYPIHNSNSPPPLSTSSPATGVTYPTTPFLPSFPLYPHSHSHSPVNSNSPLIMPLQQPSHTASPTPASWYVHSPSNNNHSNVSTNLGHNPAGNANNIYMIPMQQPMFFPPTTQSPHNTNNNGQYH